MIELSDLKSIFVVKPKQTNQRILAQQGAFFIFGLRSELRDDKKFGIEVFRTSVPARSKRGILDELDGININASTLFPEIESAAKYITRLSAGNLRLRIDHKVGYQRSARLLQPHKIICSRSPQTGDRS
jgi:hypothetical protein